MKAIGPYSTYRICQGLIFISGQLPLNEENQIQGSNIKDQTRQSLQNLEKILKQNNTDLSKVIKTTCFLSNINDFAEFNEVYAEFFNAPYPARSCFAVKDLPKNAKVEIEAIASLA